MGWRLIVVRCWTGRVCQRCKIVVPKGSEAYSNNYSGAHRVSFRCRMCYERMWFD